MATLPQTLTPYHAKYYAYELTRRCPPDSDDRLANALVDVQVDLNPHQIDVALFSFKSPLSRGVLLADEVGLGKTIEAGLVLAQRWAEQKRRILVITPSNLRKQWHQELTDKFFLPCRILEAKSYKDAIKAGQFRPFELAGQIVICSYQFARNKAADVHNTAWDVVVMDEAQRLRNVDKPSNVIANTLKQALASAASAVSVIRAVRTFATWRGDKHWSKLLAGLQSLLTERVAPAATIHCFLAQPSASQSAECWTTCMHRVSQFEEYVTDGNKI